MALSRVCMAIFLISVASGDCSVDDIVITQGTEGGVLQFEVQIVNTCVDENCYIFNIHVECGNFASYSLIDPQVFRRVSDGDCLVLNGRPLFSDHVVRFSYTNSVKFPMRFKAAVHDCSLIPNAQGLPGLP